MIKMIDIEAYEKALSLVTKEIGGEIVIVSETSEYKSVSWFVYKSIQEYLKYAESRNRHPSSQ